MDNENLLIAFLTKRLQEQDKKIESRFGSIDKYLKSVLTQELENLNLKDKVDVFMEQQTSIANSLLNAVKQKIESDVETELFKTSNELVKSFNKFIEDSQVKVDKRLDSIKVKDGKDGKDGQSPTEEYLISLIKPLIPEVVASEVTAEEIVDKLESLENDERLDVSAIKGIDDLVQEKVNKKKVETVYVGGGKGGNVDLTNYYNKTEVDTALSTKAGLVDGKVPVEQLPSYVDDFVEYDTFGDFPATGESGKIYVDKETNTTYRWSGTTYVQIGGGSTGDFQLTSEKNQPNGYAGIKELGDSRTRLWDNVGTAQDQLDGTHIRSTAPTTADDTTAGYATHDKWIDTSVSPRVMYICDDSDSGAWSQIGADASTKADISRVIPQIVLVDTNLDLSTLTINNNYILVDASAGDIEIIIPDQALSTSTLTFKKIDNSANLVKINAGGVQKVDFEYEEVHIYFKNSVCTLITNPLIDSWIISSFN